MVATLRGLLELLVSHGHAEERGRVKAAIASLPPLWDQLDNLVIGRKEEGSAGEETNNLTQKCSTEDANESTEPIKMATTEDDMQAKPEGTKNSSKKGNITEEVKLESGETGEEVSGRVLLAWCSLFHDQTFGQASSGNL